MWRYCRDSNEFTRHELERRNNNSDVLIFNSLWCTVSSRLSVAVSHTREDEISVQAALTCPSYVRSVFLMHQRAEQRLDDTFPLFVSKSNFKWTNIRIYAVDWQFRLCITSPFFDFFLFLNAEIRTKYPRNYFSIIRMLFMSFNSPP